ncbi:MAG: hypothetical protein OHK0017_01300 [Patescibacteria group bacterium]
MINTTSEKILTKLHPDSIRVLQLIPQFIQSRFGNLTNVEYEVMQNGVNTLAIKVDNEYYIKVLVNKWKNQESQFLPQITQNYTTLIQYNLPGICPECLYFSPKDEILNAAVYVQKALAGKPLVELFYGLNVEEQHKLGEQIAEKLKQLHHLTTSNYNTDNNWRIKMFDNRFN